MYVSHWSLLVIQVFLLLCRVLACWATGLRDIQLCLMCSQLLILFTHRQSVFFYHDSHTHFSVSHKMRARWQSVMCQSLSLNIPPLRREENRLNPFAHGWLQLIKPHCHSLTWHEPPRLSFFFFFHPSHADWNEDWSKFRCHWLISSNSVYSYPLYKEDLFFALIVFERLDSVSKSISQHIS